MKNLIDSIYINDGGGKILLEFLLKSLINKNKNKNYFLLLDSRINIDENLLNKFKYKTIKNSVIKRHFFYLKNRGNFRKILCFGNVPPTVAHKETLVITYFHQPNYVKELEVNLSGIKYFFKKVFINYFLKNSSFIIVQTMVMKKKFSIKFNYPIDKIKILPFFPEFKLQNNTKKLKYYFYPSLGYPHKNHELLLNVFCEFYKSNKDSKLILTIPENFKYLHNKINELIKTGVPIENLGFIPRKKLIDYYAKSEFLLFPSREESFGLGLIEGVQLNCKLICPDLDYVSAVCQPSLVFKANDELDLYNKMILSSLKKLPKSKLNVKNEINSFLELID